jgi:hypothetical protein
MDYLIVAEADDGTWYDEGETAVGIGKARALAKTMKCPRGYDVTIYRLEYVEHIEAQSQNSK